MSARAIAGTPVGLSRTQVVRRVLTALALAGLFAQALIVARVRPGDFITGIFGIVDIVRRALPPDVTHFGSALWPALETFDIALVGTAFALVLAIPTAIFAARNVTPSPALYIMSRAIIAFCRAVPDLIWALIFVTAVGLGPFPGVLALSVHSVGMLGRLFAEVIEDMDMGPVEALTLTGASRTQVFTHAVIPGVLPSLLGISLYRLDENVRSSLVLGFVGAGGIGFQILTAMNLFQYREVSLYLAVTFVLVVAVERVSAAARRAVA